MKKIIKRSIEAAKKKLPIRPSKRASTMSHRWFLLSMIPFSFIGYWILLSVSLWVGQFQAIPASGILIYGALVLYLGLNVVTNWSSSAFVSGICIIVSIPLIVLVIRPEVNLLGFINIRQAYVYNAVAVLMMLLVGAFVRKVFANGWIAIVPAGVFTYIGAYIATFFANAAGFNWGTPGDAELAVAFSFSWASGKIISDALQRVMRPDIRMDTLFQLLGVAFSSTKKVRIAITNFLGFDDPPFEVGETRLVGGATVEVYTKIITVGRKKDEIIYFVDPNSGTITHERVSKSWVKAVSEGMEQLRAELNLDGHIRVVEDNPYLLPKQ